MRWPGDSFQYSGHSGTKWCCGPRTGRQLAASNEDEHGVVQHRLYARVRRQRQLWSVAHRRTQATQQSRRAADDDPPLTRGEQRFIRFLCKEAVAAWIRKH